MSKKFIEEDELNPIERGIVKQARIAMGIFMLLFACFLAKWMIEMIIDLDKININAVVILSIMLSIVVWLLIVSYRLLSGKKRKDKGIISPTTLSVLSFIFAGIGAGIVIYNNTNNLILSFGGISFTYFGIKGVSLAVQRRKTNNELSQPPVENQ